MQIMAQVGILVKIAPLNFSATSVKVGLCPTIKTSFKLSSKVSMRYLYAVYELS